MPPLTTFNQKSDGAVLVRLGTIVEGSCLAKPWAIPTHQIKTVQEWKWADNAENSGRLDFLLNELREKMSPIQMLYSTEEPGTLKKKYGQIALMEALLGFIALSPSINSLAEVVQTMQRRHVVPTSSSPKAARNKKA